MSDIPSTSPDNSAVLHQNQTPSHYERVLGKEYPIQSNKIKGVIIDVKDKNITIITNPEKYSQLQNTKQQTEALSENLKQEFIEKLKKLPDFEWSKVQKAIEKQTIEIKKIPDRKAYVIYENKKWNLIYITELDWKPYTNIDYFREKPFFEDWIKSWYLRQWYSKIEISDWLWKLFSKDWKEIPIFSDEYSTATLNAVNTMWDVYYALKNEIKRRWIND